MKNLKFKFSYKSQGSEITQFCKDKQISISPIENCTGREVIEILCPLINQIIEVGIYSFGNVEIEDDIIYIEYEVSNEEDLITKLKEVFMVSQLDFTRRIDVFGPKDTEDLSFEFYYKCYEGIITNYIHDKLISIDLCSNCSEDDGLLIFCSLILNELIDIGEESSGKIEIIDDIVYIQYSIKKLDNEIEDKKVYHISVLNFTIETI